MFSHLELPYDSALTTLKQKQPEGDIVYLVPENDTMQPIEIRGAKRKKLMIPGVAVCVAKQGRDIRQKLPQIHY